MKSLADLILYWIIALLGATFGGPRVPPLIIYLVIGAVLGNTKVVDPDDIGTQFFGEFAITLVFFALGFEETVEHFMEGLKMSWGVAFLGAVFPFAAGWVCGIIFFPSEGWWVHMMMGTAVTATAVSLTMVLLVQLDLLGTKAAMSIMTSAVLDDVLCLIMVSILVPIAIAASPAKKLLSTASSTCGCLNTTLNATKTALYEQTGGVSTVFIVLVCVYVVVFFVILWILHIAILPHDMKEETHGWIARVPYVSKYGAKHILSIQDGKHVSLMVVTFAFGLGMLGVNFGFHPAIGAYFAGLILSEPYFELEATEDGKPGTNTMEEATETVCNAAFMWLGPIFFVRLGATIQIEGSMLSSAIPKSLGILGILGVVQFLSAGLSAKYVPGGYSWAESTMIGFGMLGRGELYFVVLGEAKKNDIFSKEVLFTFALTALLINLCLAMTITWFTPVFRKYHPVAEGETEPTAEETKEPISLPEVTINVPTPLATPRPTKKPSSLIKVKRGIGMGRSERFDAEEYLQRRRSLLPVGSPGNQGNNPAVPNKTRSALIRRAPESVEDVTSITTADLQPRRAKSSITQKPESVRKVSF